ncbi:MAG: hypothetical protein JWO94_3456, partial [Verrucomicrobiaceae bacterium]|nr:hypothetical protein [Verrucomicrobiaceae bacterium]
MRLTDSQTTKGGKLRLVARHQLFPQVLQIVQEFADRR